MESWTIKDIKTWLKHFDNNTTANYFLGGSDQETIKKAKRILKEKQRRLDNENIKR